VDGVSAKVDSSDERRILLAFVALGDDAEDGLRATNQRLLVTMAAAVASAARSSSRQSALLAPTVAIRGDQVTVGGSARVGSRRALAYKILFGAEFGATRYRQFRLRRTRGYWLTPTVTAQRTRAAAAWRVLVADAARRWGSAG
jgi:hypothetical protein